MSSSNARMAVGLIPQENTSMSLPSRNIVGVVWQASPISNYKLEGNPLAWATGYRGPYIKPKKARPLPLFPDYAPHGTEDYGMMDLILDFEKLSLSERPRRRHKKRPEVLTPHAEMMKQEKEYLLATWDLDVQALLHPSRDAGTYVRLQQIDAAPEYPPPNVTKQLIGEPGHRGPR